MAGFQRSVVIDRPVAEVFDFATNLDNASVMMPSIVKCELLTPGEMKAGSQFRETRRFGKKERSAVIDILEHRRPEEHTATAAMFGFRATYRFLFTPEGQGTRVTMEAILQGNLFWKPFLGLMRKSMEKEDGNYLQRLKEGMDRQAQRV